MLWDKFWGWPGNEAMSTVLLLTKVVSHSFEWIWLQGLSHYRGILHSQIPTLPHHGPVKIKKRQSFVVQQIMMNIARFDCYWLSLQFCSTQDGTASTSILAASNRSWVKTNSYYICETQEEKQAYTLTYLGLLKHFATNIKIFRRNERKWRRGGKVVRMVGEG